MRVESTLLSSVPLSRSWWCAVSRRPLTRFGQWLQIDRTAAPAWLIAQGADATGEALLDLAAHVAASGDPRARTVLTRLAEGVAAMRAGTDRSWPFGAILPWALSRSVWHAWGGLAPAGLARAFAVTATASFRDAALADTASFTPRLLIAAGPGKYGGRRVSRPTHGRRHDVINARPARRSPGAAGTGRVSATPTRTGPRGAARRE